MSAFYVVAAGLCAIAIAFAVWSLWRRPRIETAVDREAFNVALYRARAAEIERDANNGTIDEPARQSMLAELGASLLDEAGEPRAAATRTDTHRERLSVALACALFIPLVATLLYRQLGAQEDWALADALTVLRAAPENNDLEALDRLVAMLDERLVERPGDAETLYLLGHARMRQGEYAAAVVAFGALQPLATGDLTALVSLAQAQYLADEGRVTSTTKVLADRALAVNPHEPLVLEMLALDALRTANHAGAVRYLEQALAGGLDGPRAAALEAGLARARAALAAAPAAPINEPATPTLAAPAAPVNEPAAPVNEPAAARVHVAVSLAPSTRPAPGARVFVIARQIGGPPMPIAVRALNIAELPAVVELSDAQAMQPGRLLSQFDRVEVLARLSQSGTPTRQAGDLEAGSGPIDPRANPRLTLTIGG